MPLVCLDRPLPGLSADTVLSDNEGGMRSAVEHLAAHRHERIGFLGDDASIWTARRRHAAFCAAAASLGLPGPMRTCSGPVRRRVRPRRPPRRVDGRDDAGHRSRHGQQPGDDWRCWRPCGATTRPLSLVGYDDFELADVLDPPVTVVHQDPLVLGERAVQQVFARLVTGLGEPTTVVVPTRLVVRASGRGAGGRAVMGACCDVRVKSPRPP